MRSATGTRARRVAATALMVGVCSDAYAQVFQVQAGKSSIYDAAGGTVVMRSRQQEVRVGIGVFQDKVQIGALARRVHDGYTFSFGDSDVDLRLPTNVTGGTRYIATRGASVAFERGSTKIFALAGTSARSLGASFFQGAEGGRPLGILFIDRPLTPGLVLFSRNIIGTRQTSLNGLGWKPHVNLELKGAAGVGAGDRHSAVSAALDRGWLQARAGYVDTSREFREVTSDPTAIVDAVRESISVAVRPTRTSTVRASHQNLVQPDAHTRTGAEVSVNHVAMAMNYGATRVGSGIYRTRGGRIDNVGASVNVGHTLTTSTEVNANYFGSATRDSRFSHSVVASVRQTVHPRLSVATYATYIDRQTQLKVGGQFLSNLLSLSVDYQTVHTPFRREGPFVHGLSLTTVIQPFGTVSLQFATLILPDGRLRYTVSGSQLLRRARRGAGEQNAAASGIPKYLVRGRVVDEAGTAVAGALLRVDGVIVVTDDQGHFFVRTGKARALPLEVLTADFKAVGRFRLVSAPSTISATTEEKAKDVSVVVTRQ